jgi:hypothetical protein
MKPIIILFLAAGLLTLGTSCGSTKKVISGVIAPKDSSYSVKPIDSAASKKSGLADSLSASLTRNYINFNTFSGKLKLESSDNKGKNPDITAIVKIVKDSAIWLSLTATILNIEVYRVYITPDSVVLLDKRAKEVQYRSLDYLQTITQIPFSFTTIQNLLIGNPIFYNADKAEYSETANNFTGFYVGNEFKHLLSIDKQNKLVTHSKLDDLDASRQRTASISYETYSNIDGFNFANDRKIFIAEQNKIDLNLKFVRVEFNKQLEINFSVPKGYKTN